MRTAVLILAGILSLSSEGSAFADEIKYRPGGKQFARVWNAFYAGDHEPELPAPLVAAGSKMTLAICEAVAQKDMMYRRYAIAALGIVTDRRALPTLESIMKDDTEIDYFRGDALQSIFRIDRTMGRRYAKQYSSGSDYLSMIAAAVERNERWLTAPWGKH